MSPRPLAVVTGASTGIGFELARCCAEGGFDLVIVADEAEIERAAHKIATNDAKVEPIEANLATRLRSAARRDRHPPRRSIPRQYRPQLGTCLHRAGLGGHPPCD